MKRLLLALALFAAASASAVVLSTSTKLGAKTTVTVGRVQGDPAADGTLVLQVIPREVVTLSDGTILSDNIRGEWLTVPLSSATLTALNADIMKARIAADAARAKAATKK